ncbi:hypothetical protein CYMTET_57015 [Cymbomonas tetramitiformis]|uniref:Uncharacterized protein n=1 Tax=Cymbomonas tetramitiformis TaxID=36881 RepID=A0AAE0BB66_9CHLO|nr:hypothetical protein CYMTET_57015 [Cymbomonas tetramitiformis]
MIAGSYGDFLVYPVEQHSASGAASLSDALRQTATYNRLSSIAESVSFDVRADGVEDAGAEALAAGGQWEIRRAADACGVGDADNCVGAAGAVVLAAALRDANCKLHTLNIDGNGISDAGEEALAAAFRDAHCKLHTLDIGANGISVAGAEALAAALRDANCKLHALDITYNAVGAAGAEALAAALRDANCKLYTLNIYGQLLLHAYKTIGLFGHRPLLLMIGPTKPVEALQKAF